MERRPDHLLLSTLPPWRNMATIDLKLRGFRSGYATTGRLVGEEWDKRRKKYSGQGWQQQIVDDAVKYLKDIEKTLKDLKKALCGQ